MSTTKCRKKLLKVALNSFIGVQIVLHFKNLWLRKIHFPCKQRLWQKTWQKSQKSFPVYKKHTFHHVSFVMRILRMCRCWSCEVDFFVVFDAYFQQQSVNCRYFWPIRLNESNKCLDLFQRISVNRKPNKWVNRRNRIFFKICWQDFMKYTSNSIMEVKCCGLLRLAPYIF